MKRVDGTYEKLFLREDYRLDTPAGFYHRLWVPPEVECVPFPTYCGYEFYAGCPAVEFSLPRQQLWYAETATGSPCVSTSDLRFLADQQEGWKRWQQKTDTRELLHDFLKLTHKDVTEEQVIKFAERWGPLWRCRQQICLIGFPPCYAYMDNSDYCFWSPYELISEYLLEARRAKSALDIFIASRDKQPVSEALWSQIKSIELSELEAKLEAEWKAEQKAKYGLTEPMHDPEAERAMKCPTYAAEKGWHSLVEMVNTYLEVLGRPVTSMTYAESLDHPTFRVASSLGFLRVVWIEIARIISDTVQYYRCDGCRTYYKRTKKAPKPGQRNYCEDCEKGGYQHSKNQSKARNRPKG